MKFIVQFFIIFVVLVFTSCGNRISNGEIKNSWWKYGSGYHVGDALRFDDTNLRGDTIFINNKPVAIISYCGKRTFSSSAILEIQSIETAKYGTYHDKGPK